VISLFDSSSSLAIRRRDDSQHHSNTTCKPPSQAVVRLPGAASIRPHSAQQISYLVAICRMNRQYVTNVIQSLLKTPAYWACVLPTSLCWKAVLREFAFDDFCQRLRLALVRQAVCFLIQDSNIFSPSQSLPWFATASNWIHGRLFSYILATWLVLTRLWSGTTMQIQISLKQYLRKLARRLQKPKHSDGLAWFRDCWALQWKPGFTPK